MQEDYAQIATLRELAQIPDRWGFSPVQLAQLLGKQRELALLIPDLHAPKRQIFQEEYSLVYWPHLVFDSFALLRRVYGLCRRYWRRGRINRRHLWLGHYYAREIASGWTPPLAIRPSGIAEGQGLFVREKLASGAYIGEYTGWVRKDKKELDAQNSYCFEYLLGIFAASSFTIDAKYQGNLLRFANHSFRPNCEAKLLFDGRIPHVVLFAKTTILPNTELTYDYGTPYWSCRENPLSD